MLLSKESCIVAQFHLMSAMAVKPSALRVDFNTWDARELEAGAFPAHKLGQRCQPGGPELGQWSSENHTVSSQQMTIRLQCSSVLCFNTF